MKWELELSWLLGIAVAIAAIAGALIAYLLTRARMDKSIRVLQLQVEQAQYSEKIAALNESHTQLKESFSALSKHALDANNQSFLQLAQQKLTFLNHARKQTSQKKRNPSKLY